MWKQKVREENGSVFIFTLFLIPVIIALGGLLIDVGMIAVDKTRLAGAVDSASWAALDSYDRELWEEEGIPVLIESEAFFLAQTYLHANMPQATLTKFVVNGNRVEVEGASVTKLFFMKMFGFHEVTVYASSKTKIG
ncbi:Tad domain-containing protein [Halalkalibacter alkalisediminis]|uniref:Tad domain-containing protein n=1 Tax=Halalkalibacter alkalisediminis TaxID=935616 RepID=A0ABV6NKE4_9BACI|nr:Tad domain-containing protein [Halalkalibacter alkalisediminis]